MRYICILFGWPGHSYEHWSVTMRGGAMSGQPQKLNMYSPRMRLIMHDSLGPAITDVPDAPYFNLQKPLFWT